MRVTTVLGLTLLALVVLVAAEDESIAEIEAAAGVKDIDPQNEKILAEAFDNQKNCMVTKSKPEKPRSLSFCHKFNDNACCAPALDQEDTEMFDAIMDLGLSCRLRGDVRDHPLARMYCMNCDPQQPRYVRNVPYTPLRSDAPSLGRDQILLVCKDWAESSFSTNPLLDLFNRCGILKSSPCLGLNGSIIQNRDRYVCGDDLIIPSAEYLRNDDGDIMKPAESIEVFLNSDSLGPPLIDEEFGFHLVENRQCEDSEVGTLTDGSNGPACLMTPAQQDSFYGVSRSETACADATFRMENLQLCTEFVQEICFNSATSVMASVSLLVFALVALLFL